MAGIPEQSVDPRIRRTRLLLQQALVKLLEQKDFDRISVQDIADTATVNRVTFYDHYTDKFALLECVVAGRFQELLAERDIQFDGTCSSALKAMILAVCDYLGKAPQKQGQREPHFESAVIAVVRRMFLEGFRRHPAPGSVPVDMLATTLSWAIYGAAQEWAQTPDRAPSEEVVEIIVRLVAPILDLLHSPPVLSPEGEASHPEHPADS